ERRHLGLARHARRREEVHERGLASVVGERGPATVEAIEVAVEALARSRSAAAARRREEHGGDGGGEQSHGGTVAAPIGAASVAPAGAHWGMCRGGCHIP